MKKRRYYVITWLVLCLLQACSGDDSDVSGYGTGAGNVPCSGSCATDNPQNLTVSDIEQIISQGTSEAKALGRDATIAVVDRVGNVLAVYRTGLPVPVLIASAPAASGQASRLAGGLEGILLPNNNAQTNLSAVYIDDQAAIAKALTGAYFSSEGNALSTRTASQVIQEHFNPGELFQPAGPLFGVQFSQLACSDFNFKDITRSEGPKKSPLGFAADPGGLPLYKNGTVVGSVGVMADGLYSLDKVITDEDRNIDELIATAASFRFSAPLDIRADRIAVDGKTLRFSDVGFGDLRSNPQNAPAFGSADVPAAGLIAVKGYSDGTIKEGVAFAQPASGIRAAGNAGPFSGLDAFIFVDSIAGNDPVDGLPGVNRFPPIAGAEAGVQLSQLETQTILQEALRVANKTRRQVGRPLNGPARVNITMVDSLGNIIGMVRSRDAIVDGADVTVQKARTAAFFSSDKAAGFISNDLPSPGYLVTNNDDDGLPLPPAPKPLADYISVAETAFRDTTIFNTNDHAFSQRALGLIAFPFYADGVDGTKEGPFSKPNNEWSIFNIGLQLDVVYNAILQHVLFTAGVIGTDVGIGCVGVNIAPDLSSITNTITEKHIANGMQTFAGAVPIYKGNTLVGGIGVSGDGNDQADLIAFLGVHNAGLKLGTVNNAPPSLRADTLSPRDVRLRYIQCPFSPFIGSNAQNVCEGL